MAARNGAAVESDLQGPGEYTIDHLAQASGVTVRNIRAHQSRALLPPPAVRGRTGFYTAEHLDRLRLIAEMQADGFNLNSIKRILENLPEGSAGQVLGFEHALRQPWADERAEVVTVDSIAGMGGAGGDDALLKKAIKLGLIVPLGEDRFEVPSPTLLAVGPELESLGVDLATRLAVLEKIQKHTEGVSQAFIDLFLEHIWKPFHEAGRPDEEWPRVHDALQRLRPIATQVLLAAFGQSMSRGVDAAFGKALEEAVNTPQRRPALGKPDGGRARRPRGGSRLR
ncbi:MAG TPA: MerR family transcriptional regulator [Candidatus Dormibacteraeota bacterium]|nr:MerR family transcriptional regulator [Candidatus Dormibacteraeota bacterium]